MIGGMQQRITFLAPVSTAVGGGGSETTYTDVLTDWCRAKPLKASRELVEYQTALKTGYRFTIRQWKGWQPDKSMLISYNGQKYTINSILPDTDKGVWFWHIVGVEQQQNG
ncbi:phage head closure protein [Chitinophaga oryzae]|uniref:Phage head closure protein n=1 Tax=Chitinophaga oryzae TaxID=2725414 RepID=A0ABX6LHY0_9BACT|nr:phage head closure protein [Chitinophaga oryzae]QJB39731.1 phage head closure protein [Chitinophaga oryzae]